MDVDEKKRFSRAFGTLNELFDRKTSLLLTNAYFNSLSRFSIEEVELAISTAITKCRFFPKPVELIEMIEGPTKDVMTKDIALEQVEDVMQQLRNIGSWGTPVFKDPITNRLMSSRWTWKSICSMTEEEHTWWAKEFIEAYQSSVRVEGYNPMQLDCGSKILKSLTCKIGNIE